MKIFKMYHSRAADTFRLSLVSRRVWRVFINEHTWAIAGANDKKKKNKEKILLLPPGYMRARSGTELGPYGVNERNNNLLPHHAVPFLINQY